MAGDRKDLERPRRGWCHVELQHVDSPFCWLMGISGRRRTDEALENLSPALAHLLDESIGRGAEALKVPVLEAHLRLPGAERGERHLDLGEKVGVVLELPVELPREEDAAWRIPGQHLAPFAGRAVRADLVPAAVRLRLDHAVLQ